MSSDTTISAGRLSFTGIPWTSAIFSMVKVSYFFIFFIMSFYLEFEIVDKFNVLISEIFIP